MKSPLVSVLISTRNRKEYCLLALQSVLDQTYTNLEIIIHDASTNSDTHKEIKKIKDKRIKVFRTKENLGMVGSWNYCLKRSRGEFIKYLADDDLLEPDCVGQEVIPLIESPDVSLVTCVRTVIDSNGKKTGQLQFADKNSQVDGFVISKEILTNIRENRIGEPSAVMFRYSTGIQAGLFDPQFSQYADFEFWIRLLSFGDLVFINRPLCSFRIHPTSGTTAALSDGRYIDETGQLISKYYDDPNLSSRYQLGGLKFRVKLQKTLDFLKTIKDIFISAKFRSSFQLSSKTLKFILR